MQKIEDISEILSTMNKDEITIFLTELLTSSEIQTLSKRWSVVKMLATTNNTQREIARNLSVSLCKVTSGSKILKSSNTIIKKIIKGETNGIKRTTNN